jgi:signal transduction histidine kinase/ActR/RegA family two-component response regulator
MSAPDHLPGSLARRFALVAAGLAAAAVMVTALASWWLINQQHNEALRQLAAKETEFHAAAVGSDLEALAERMAEVAGSTILATGLVDSAGRETYLAPFLAGIRQVNGVPVQVLFTDFEGKEIASNGEARFTPAELKWLARELEIGRPASTIFEGQKGYVLVALAPLTYSRTQSPEGALLYKFSLNDLHVGERMRLEWGEPVSASDSAAVPVSRVSTPAVFQALQFRVRGALPITSLTAALAPQYIAIFVIALILFGAVVIAGRRLAQVLTHDLQRLEAFSSKYISSGLSTERAPVAGSDEVASLARSINRMLDRLHEQHADLLREREKLSVLAEALQTADRRKDEFLAMLAHELRNPLAPIRNSVMMMKVKPLADPHLEWARDVVDRQVDHMARLLDDLLDVSRITRNKLELRKARVSLRQIIDAAVETSRPLIEAAGHELSIDVPAEPLYLDADALRLAQVFANLLNNSAKYTPQGGRIRLSATTAGSDVLVTVHDNGIGIPQEQLSHIFEMFMQTAASPHHTQGGLGIGLSLVRGLVEMHGGTVSVRSDGPAKGSEFTVSLPLAAATHETAAPAATPDLVERAARRIVVADDNRDAGETLGMMLSMAGHDVHIAYDGVQAIRLAAEIHPQVVLLDIGMPNMNGYEAAARIRSEPWGASILLIALTGWGQEKDRQRASEAGFDHHLVKPADPAVLEKLIADVPRATSGSARPATPPPQALPASL